MENNRSHLIATGQVDSGNGSNALAIQNDVLRTDSISCSQCMPCSVNICVEILLGRFASAGSISGIIVTEDVAVDALAESHEKAGHLAEVDGISVREEKCESIK